MPPSVRTYMTIDKVTGVKSLKQNNMPVFFISSQFIYYIFILQVLSNLFLNGQNVSDTVLNVITNHKKMVEKFFRGGNAPPCPPLDPPLQIMYFEQIMIRKMSCVFPSGCNHKGKNKTSYTYILQSSVQLVAFSARSQPSCMIIYVIC